VCSTPIAVSGKAGPGPWMQACGSPLPRVRRSRTRDCRPRERQRRASCPTWTGMGTWRSSKQAGTATCTSPRATAPTWQGGRREWSYPKGRSPPGDARIHDHKLVSRPVIADLDGDSDWEIVVRTQISDTHEPDIQLTTRIHVAAFHHDGEPLEVDRPVSPHSPPSTERRRNSSPRVPTCRWPRMWTTIAGPASLPPQRSERRGWPRSAFQENSVIATRSRIHRERPLCAPTTSTARPWPIESQRGVGSGPSSAPCCCP
jgi:hypothetical protein